VVYAELIGCVRYSVKAVGVSFGSADPFGLKAVSKYEEALLRSKGEGVPVKALLLCSPHNPLGMTYYIPPIVIHAQLTLQVVAIPVTCWLS
jgi:hypothetical protein